LAGSYLHTVTDSGRLRRDQSIAAENLGDAYETIEEMYGMIWWLASGSEDRVELARRNYRAGLAMSPGVEIIDE
jgi:hypothetical protein